MKPTSLLIEIGTEELPPKALLILSHALAQGLFQHLQARDFLTPTSIAQAYATPRRLAVVISHVRAHATEKTHREKILPVTLALDANGQATALLTKKLATLSQQLSSNTPCLTLQHLERAQNHKNQEHFFYTTTLPGLSLQVGVQAALEATLAALPIPKRMSYQRAGKTVHFVRPAHTLIALYGDEIVPVSTLGLTAGRITLGHRFLSKGPISIPSAQAYVDTLHDAGKVVASFEKRREMIRKALLAAANNEQVLMPNALLDEVTSLVEWPIVYRGQFNPDFLNVPQECLILAMQTHQKCFALTDDAHRLRPAFLLVSNLQTPDPKNIITGNERTMQPRLSDAQFFFEQDKKKRLIDRVPALAQMVYHSKLGNQYERTQRVQALAVSLGVALNADAHHTKRAALLAKTDLLTDMVGEFPELQGIMGRIYALLNGEADEVAAAISAHYQPRFSGDALPTSAVATAVALADKLETLVGIWGIGSPPSGDKDPFALRRCALGILRMLIEKRLPLSLQKMIHQAVQTFHHVVEFHDPSQEVLAFLYDRSPHLLRERGYSTHEIQAVMATSPDRLDHLLDRMDAVRTFSQLPKAHSLIAAHKRIHHLLKKNAHHDKSTPVHSEWLIAPAEKQLLEAMHHLQPLIEEALVAGHFTQALTMLAQIEPGVNTFFKHVMVMTEDNTLRTNRLALLCQLHDMFNRVANIAQLAPSSPPR